MPTQKDCPLCGSVMHLKETQSQVHVPGNPQTSSKRVREWICPDCDYFEETDDQRDDE
jgi:transposase